MTQDRVTARIGSWEPPSQYNQPILEPESGIRDVEHEVLGDVTIIQQTGLEAETFTLRGDAFAEDISTLRNMRGTEQELRHEIYSGDVLIRNVRASSTGSWENVDGERKWVYTYTLKLVAVT